MVPEIQLMMRVERDAEVQRRPTWKDSSDFSIYELIRPSVQVNRFKHLVGRFAASSHTLKVQNQGALQCNCAN